MNKANLSIFSIYASVVCFNFLGPAPVMSFQLVSQSDDQNLVFTWTLSQASIQDVLIIQICSARVTLRKPCMDEITLTKQNNSLPRNFMISFHPTEDDLYNFAIFAGSHNVRSIRSNIVQVKHGTYLSDYIAEAFLVYFKSLCGLVVFEA